jgi:hypothetical protein
VTRACHSGRAPREIRARDGRAPGSTGRHRIGPAPNGARDSRCAAHSNSVLKDVIRGHILWLNGATWTTNMRFALLLPALLGSVLSCRSLPPSPKAEAVNAVVSSAEQSHYYAAAAEASSSAAAASPSSATVNGPTVVEHPAGQLPAHRLEHCALHAGQSSKHRSVSRGPRTTGEASPNGPAEVSRTCSFDSECVAHRGDMPGPSDGTVSISCTENRCSCTVTTYVPSEMNHYTFVQVDPCRDLKALLRERCGG